MGGEILFVTDEDLGAKGQGLAKAVQISIAYGLAIVLFFYGALQSELDAEKGPENTSFA